MVKFRKVAAPTIYNHIMMRQADHFRTTERIAFRTWTSEDLALAIAIWGDSEVTRFVGGPFSEEQVQEKLNRETENLVQYGVQYWPIFLLNGEHAECAGLRPARNSHLAFEMGHYLLPRYWGQGLAVETGRCIVEHAFRTLGAEQLVAAHHPANIGSGRVLEKLGFRFSHLELYPPTGLMHRCYTLVHSVRGLTGG
jgi:RimJ/RimL family protein N-acetyltransferase